MAAMELGQTVSITAGKYAGQAGVIEGITAKMLKVLLADSDEQVSIMQSSVNRRSHGEAQVPAMPQMPQTAESPFKVGDTVTINSGAYKGETGKVAKINPCKATIRLHGADQKTVPISYHQLSLGSFTASVATTAVPQTPMEELEEETDRGDGWGMLSIVQGVKKIILQDKKPQECFLTSHFKGRSLCVEEALTKTSSIKAHYEHGEERQRFTLVSVKVENDGYHFWGGQKQCVRGAYVAELPGRELREELEEIANFAALTSGRKVASRMQLLQSPGTVLEGFRAADLEKIPEPLSKASGGCGFIGPALLQQLTAQLTLPKARRQQTTSLQVRVFGPRVGVLKGVLTLKPGIQGIQYPASMEKVGPSRSSEADWITVVVCKVFPSDPSFKIAKMLKTGVRPKGLPWKKLSPMLELLLKSLGLAEELPRYAKESIRKEAFLVGVADPTGGLPEDSIFVPGLQEHLSACEGTTQVLVTRCPCVQASDGKRLRVVTERPGTMSEADWQALLQRPLGELIFPRGSAHALPERIAEGDLDGDLYWVCWDASLVASAKEEPEVERTETAELPRATAELGSAWLRLARQHMLDPEVLEQRNLIGRLYRAAEKRAKSSHLGLRDPDAQALFRAYVQCIDSGKHGNEIDIPQHLRKEVGLK